VNGAFTCPYCGKPGISFISKLISAAATLGGWPARCNACGQPSRIGARASRLQLGVLVIALATIPWIFEGDERLTAGYLAAALIVAVGLFAPLHKDLLS
jgi:hypothetical protein